MGFENKVIFITGGASGFGEAIAIKFAELSAKLALIDINEESLKKVTEKCRKLNAEVLKCVVDVTKDEEVKGAVNKTVCKYGRIDVVVNSAGIFKASRILDSDVLNVFDSVINVNLRSSVAVTHYAAPALIETKGCVVNFASIVARLVNKDSVSYNISKAGIVHFTKSVALDLAEHGVRVNCILPGPVHTKLLFNAGMSEEDSQKRLEYVTQSSPLKQYIEAEEIAEMVEYLASDRARSITGAEFIIDAGICLAGVRNVEN